MKRKKFRLPYFIFSFILSTLNVMGVLFIPVLIGKILDVIYSNENAQNLIIITFLLVIVNVITNYYSQLFMKKYVIYTSNNQRIDLENNLLYSKIKELDKESSGSVANKIITNVNTIRDGNQQFYLTFLPGLLTVSFTLLFLFYIDKKIAFYVSLSTPIIILCSLLLASISRKYFKIEQTSMNRLTSKTKETLELMKYIKAEKIEEYKKNELEKLSKEHTKASRTAIFFSSLANPTARFLNGVVVILVIILGVDLVNNEIITVGVLSTIVLLTNNYSKPINEVTSTLTQILLAKHAKKNLMPIIKLKKEEEKETIIKLRGNIKFENVSFRYDDKIVLENISFTINQGEKVAIVGETGSGKTTIINLLLEFYDNYQGRILIDGFNLKELNTKELRNQIGVILQDSWMNSTNPVEVVNYKKRKVDNHKYKYTNNLSDGQKQLLAIERLDYKLKKVIILDEATSDIDAYTEKELTKKIEDITRDKTTIVIAHKFKTIETADKIIVIKNGKIDDIGTHRELLKKNGEYTSIYNSL